MRENDGKMIPRFTRFIEPISAIFFDGERFLSRRGTLSELPYDECYYPVGNWGHSRSFKMPNGVVVWWNEPPMFRNPTQIVFSYKGATLESIPDLENKVKKVAWPSTADMVAACNRYLSKTEEELAELKKAQVERANKSHSPL